MRAWLRRTWQRWRDARTLRRLAGQARSPNPALRAQAAAGLAHLRAEQSAPELLRLLEDTHTPVREAAQAGLRQLGPAAQALLLVALNHANPEVGRFAAEVLGNLGRAEVVGPLIVALKYAPRPVQMACRRALVRLGPLALPALQAVVESPQSWVQQQVREILAEVGTTAAEQPDAS